MLYETVIGLEVHVQLKTKSKIFCGCKTDFGALPNTQVCPVCLGFPGSLPVLNKEVLNLGARTAFSLNCNVEHYVQFDRKSYFYPDLPKAYQISQLYYPLATKGFININVETGEKRIGITRAHLEEDAGKLVHEKDVSFVDFNRCGTPLLEIVSEPDINSPSEAYSYLTALKAILEYIEVSDCNMEEGSLRCDANVSIRKKGDTKLGVKAEIKNMNSFKGVKLALEYEVKRQIDLLEKGERIIQETMLFNADKGITESMRSKEKAHDYRYFPEPDLVPFELDDDFFNKVKKALPELPDAKKKRFISEYKLSEYDAQVMIDDKNMAQYFEEVISLYKNPKVVANWLMGDIMAYMKENNLKIRELNLKKEYLRDMLVMIDNATISGKIAKFLIIDIIKRGESPKDLVKEKGLKQITDNKEIESIIESVISENQKIVDDYKKGKQNAIMALVGKVMAKTKGKANPKVVNEILKKGLG